MMAEHFARNVLNFLILCRGSGIFRVAFLFDCHYLIENALHIFRCVPARQVVVASFSSAATRLGYHFFKVLSTGILNLLKFLVDVLPLLSSYRLRFASNTLICHLFDCFLISDESYSIIGVFEMQAEFSFL